MKIDQERAGLFGLFSDECKIRMSDPVYLDVMSKIYIGIIGCKYDEVNFFNNPMHKEKIGAMVVIIDFASVLLMLYFFSKINSLNNELLEKVDDLRVQMKDFGIQINNVILDKYTSDSRVVKIKIWLYFRDILKSKIDRHNDM